MLSAAGVSPYRKVTNIRMGYLAHKTDSDPYLAGQGNLEALAKGEPSADSDNFDGMKSSSGKTVLKLNIHGPRKL